MKNLQRREKKFFQICKLLAEKSSESWFLRFFFDLAMLSLFWELFSSLAAKKCPQCFSNGNSLLVLPTLLLNILFYCSVDFCNIKISSAGGDVTAFYNSKTVNIICIGCSAAPTIRCFYFSDIRCG